MPNGYDLTQDPAYQQILNAMVTNAPSDWNQTNSNQVLGNQVQQFSSMYQNLTGQAPSQDIINQFSQNIQTGILNSPTGEGGSNYASNQNLITPYLENTYGPQITANQTAQQQKQLQSAQSQIAPLIQQQVASTEADLTNPNSPTYQQFSGQLNNLGITPGSGAFQAGVGGTLGKSAAGDISAALGGVSLPSISGQLGSAAAPYAQTLNSQYPGLNTYGGIQQNQIDFNQESALGQMLAQMSQPSTAQKDIGMAAGASQALGGLGQGVGAASTVTWICTALQKEGVLARFEIRRLHDHLFEAFWKRPFKFIGYLLFGKLAVLLSGWVKIDLADWKLLFYDIPMLEKDSVKAVDLYAHAFFGLLREIRKRLRIKMMIVYDNPKGERQWH